MASKLPLLLLLIAITCLSQFYRVSNSVIAPELTRDLGLSARQLGWAGSAFFFALFAVQVPVGMWFDRYGARRTVAALSVLAMLGALWIAAASDAADLIGGRAVVGVGCAASFMSAVFLCARWFPPAKLATAMSWVFAASNIGTLAAATPLAWIAATVGWRNGFIGLAAVTVLVAVAFYAIVRDRPPDKPTPPVKRESFGEIVRGLLEVWTTPGLVPVLAMHFFAYATMLTVLGVWGGPYLYDVHKLDAVQRGNVLLVMGVAQIVGILAYGPMDRLLRSRKKVVVGGAAISVALLAVLAVLPKPPLALTVVLLSAFCFFCAFGTVIVAQGRALFPDRLAGRGVTTVNMAQCLGLTVLPALVGYIVEAFGNGDLAYRVAFGVLGLGLVLGAGVYVRSRDSATATAMSRRIVAVAAALLAILLALAVAAQPARAPAPERNVETGLTFPDTIGPARKVGSIDYGQSNGAPELGYAWNYETQAITTTFYIYNFGIAHIPSGARGSVVLTQFQQAIADIETGARAGRYEELKPSQGPGDCTVGAMVFRCVTFTAVLPRDQRPVFTRLFVTGYRNYVLKIRQDWPQNEPEAAREVDAVVQAFANSASPRQSH